MQVMHGLKFTEGSPGFFCTDGKSRESAFEKITGGTMAVYKPFKGCKAGS